MSSGCLKTTCYWVPS